MYLKFMLILRGLKKEARKIINISACIIAKNEAKHIPTWLTCVRQIANEILVVDTGSTDKTVELAKQGGAKVLFFPWCNDFAKAKNFALDNVTGEWVIFLDADEYFPQTSIEKLKKAIKRYHPKRKVIGLMCRLLNLDADDNLRLISVIRQVRVFRNLKSLRYVGKIHEALMSKALGNRTFQEVPEIEIYHTGYSTSVLKAKLERNLEMLEAKAKEEGGEKDEDSVYYLSCYYGLGDFEKAEKYAKIAVNSGIRFLGLEMSIYRQYISTLVFLNRPFKEILAVIDEAYEKYPNSVEFLFTKAFYYAREGDYLEASNILKEVDKFEGGENLKVALDDSSLMFLPEIYALKARLARLQGDFKKASTLSYEGLSHSKFKANLLTMWYKTTQKISEEEKLRRLEKYYNKEDEAEANFVIKTLFPLGALVICRHYQGHIKSPVTLSLIAGDLVKATGFLSGEILNLKSLAMTIIKEFNIPPQGSLYALMSNSEQNIWHKMHAEQ